MSTPVLEIQGVTKQFDDKHVLQGIDLKVAGAKQDQIVISGIDKQVVGQLAAELRAYRKPEPYQGKGVRYQGEYIFRKEGKKK